MIRADRLHAYFGACPSVMEMLMAVAWHRIGTAFGKDTTGPFYDWPLGADDLIFVQQLSSVLSPIGGSFSELIASRKVLLIEIANFDAACWAKEILAKALEAHFALETALEEPLNDEDGERKLPVVALIERSGNRGLLREVFSKAYRTQALVIALADPDSDERHVRTMKFASDLCAELPAVTAEFIDRAFHCVLGHGAVGVSGLSGFQDLDADRIGAILRPGRDAAECLMALRQLLGEPAEETATRGQQVLKDAAGFGAAQQWALDLASDYTLWRSGALEWDEVPERGLLVSGPPGVGKTTFARLLANTLDTPLVETSVAAWNAFDNLSGALVEMNRVFDKARTLRAVLCIDELDGISRRDRSGDRNRSYWDQVVNHLLTRVNDILECPGVIVVGATNYPEHIDPALLRAGRIERHIHIELPGEKDRALILEKYLKGTLEHEDVERVASLTDRFSGADLKSLVRSAMARARRAKRRPAISDILLELGRETVALSKSDRRRAIVYAAGREVVSRQLGVRVGQGPEYATLSDLQSQIAALVAGRVAEELVLKSASTLGEADLERATGLAEAIEVKFGMGTSGPLALRIVPQAWDLSLAIRRHIEEAIERARQLLEDRMPELEDPNETACETKYAVH